MLPEWQTSEKDRELRFNGIFDQAYFIVSVGDS